MNRHVRHAMALALATWCLVACAGLTTIPGGDSVVEGQVRVVASGLGPSGASTTEVAVAGTSIATRIGPDGRFVLDGVPAGDVDLVFRGPWGESGVRLEAVARGQTVRVAVALGAGGAALQGVSRSSDDLVLDVLPDRWQLSWREASGDDPVLAMITGDDAFLGRIDPDCFQLVGDLTDADPVLPNEVLYGTQSVALRFFGADALGLLAEPFEGSAHDIEVGFCYTADGGATAASNVLAAETHFLTATVTVADDAQAPDGFMADFDPDSIPLEPEADATASLNVRGDENALATVDEGRLGLTDDESGDNRTLEVKGFTPSDPDEDALPFLQAVLGQHDLLWLLGDDVAAGTYDLTLTLTFADDGEPTPASDATVEIPVQLNVSDDGDEEVADDELVAEVQPAAWNTNWRHVGAGWVTVKVSGTGYAEIELDDIALATSEDGSDEAPVLPRERAQRQGNHVRAFFRQRDAIGLLDDPVPGETYALWVRIAEDAALPVTVTVTGPPR